MTNLSWQIVKTPSYPVTSFIVEMSSLFTPTVYTELSKVDSAEQFVILRDLSPWASLTFRVRGQNSIGVGLPSLPQQARCITPQGRELQNKN